MLRAYAERHRLSAWLIWAGRCQCVLLSRLLRGCQGLSVCWESDFLTHWWRSVPVVVQKQLLGARVTFELQTEHFDGFAFKVLYPGPDLDERRCLRSVSGYRFL